MNFEGSDSLLVRALTTRIETLEKATADADYRAAESEAEVALIARFVWPPNAELPERFASYGGITAEEIIEELKRRGINAGQFDTPQTD